MKVTKWIDRAEYPFTSHFMDAHRGRMHYVDEGQGSPIVMVHGTPTWSFLYRNLIKELSSDYRCIAPDHIGFGLSDKPKSWSYLPEAHAQNLSHLIDKLNLKQITLMVHDFGGPIGLSYAIEHPENVRQLIVMNTWMWSLKGDPVFEKANKFVHGWLGTFLYERMNFSARVLMKKAMADGSYLPTKIHQHYIKPLSTPEERKGTLVFARALIGSSDWYDRLWRQRERIQEIPTLLFWGMKDPFLKAEMLHTWHPLFTNAHLIRFAEAGHLLPEEKPMALCEVIRETLRENRRVPT